ncbi:DUF680 domain-containing protein [Mesorhizobium sp. B2-4-12]|uniref:DUF680 domain-containing protein n=1 Tax=unclassified Mesorhizobium TaxID=325217 RepID=UPI00112675CD|nr:MULTISPECIES: DUF680 domain-containing protein [unclassified Mesorhizobium]TPK95764.1 DUF680 domain-containing protein [Mesorhizobium sp. B2-4-12]TPL12573.1 DUF680 domain-containing protein [Mesorhizobium sp. B2-4-14]
MKKTLLTLAAVLALSGSAFAASAAQPVKQAPAACVDTKTHAKLDCSATGSIEKTTTSSTEGKSPRLGIDINPWIVPNF